MSRRRLLLVASLLAAAGVLALILWHSERSEPQRPPDHPAATRQPPTAPPPPTAAAAAASVGTPDLATPPAAASPRRPLDAAGRARLSAALATARAGRPDEPALPGAAAPAPTRLDLANKTGHELSDWERRQLDALNQLLGECYDLARAENPALAGKVSLQFTVSAEPEIGGLVSEIRFDEAGTTIADAGLRECMTESLHALELEPPPAGVEASRQVTLDLSPEP